MDEKKPDLNEIRSKINGIDSQLKKLLIERLDAVSEVADYKKAHGLPVHDPARERQIISAMTAGEDYENALYISMFYSNLFEIAKTREVFKMSDEDDEGVREIIKKALSSTPDIIPASALTACQGIEGAYSQSAATKLLTRPQLLFYPSFSEVLDAVQSGSVRYGVIPIENSIAGSVSGVYEMTSERGLYIIRAVRLHITHSLLAKRGAKLNEIKRIYSHQQAIAQCSAFLGTLKDIEIIPCSNTAVAAKKAAGSEACAAICSPECRDIYGIDYVDGVPEMIADNFNNHTRFVCISNTPEIYPGADKMTMLATLQHKPGALYSLIAEFAAAGINLTKLESRPIPGRDFEYRFILDFKASVYSDRDIAVVNDISRRYGAKFLGAYSEII